MTALEWILGICGALAVSGIGAIAAIAWNLKGSFESFKGEVAAKMTAMDNRMDDRFSGFREVVELQVGHLSKQIEAFGQFEGRMTAVERSATVFEEAYDDYKPWRARVDTRLDEHDRRIGRLEPKQ